MGPPCSSFVMLNAVNCKRKHSNNYKGDEAYLPVCLGNLLATAAAFLMTVGSVRQVQVVVEKTTREHDLEVPRPQTSTGCLRSAFCGHSTVRMVERTLGEPNVEVLQVSLDRHMDQRHSTTLSVSRTLACQTHLGRMETWQTYFHRKACSSSAVCRLPGCPWPSHCTCLADCSSTTGGLW